MTQITRDIALVLVLALALGGPFVWSSCASERATKQQIAARAAESEKLWDAPVSNYNAICSLFIKSGIMPREDSLRRLKTLLASADDESERAALNYLLGEAFYWGGLSEFQKTKNKGTVLAVSDNVAEAFLSAWDAIAKVDGATATNRLRRTIVKRFNELLCTQICGACLSTNLKQQVVTRYIGRLDESELAPTLWPVEERGKAFRNLGLGDRLAAEIPKHAPRDFDELCQAMRLAWAAGFTNDALRFAETLEGQHQARIEKRWEVRRELFRIYDACGDRRALGLITKCAECNPAEWLDVYRCATRRDPKLSQEQRMIYIDNYLSRMELKQGQSMATCQALIAALVEMHDFEIAIQFADKALNDPSLNAATTLGRAHVFRLKGIAHEKRGERDKAVEAYKRGMEIVEMGGSEGVKESFRRSLYDANAQSSDEQ